MLEVSNLSTRCFSKLDIEIHAGETVTLSGSSGSGKSLLLRAIADLDPHEGEIRLAGQSQCSMAAHIWRQHISLLPADYPFWGEVAGDSFKDPSTASNILDSLGLPSNILQQSINQLSSGEKQRLSLIRLLLNQPHCLLLDEPTSHLDSETELMVESLVSDYQQQTNCPILWVSHNNSQCQRVGQQHYVLSDGKLVEAQP